MARSWCWYKERRGSFGFGIAEGAPGLYGRGGAAGRLLEEDRQDVPGCVGGEILLEYQRGTERALRTVQELRSSLYKLQAME